MRRINGRKLKKLLKKTEEIDVKMFNLLKVGKKVTVCTTTVNAEENIIVVGFKITCNNYDNDIYYECIAKATESKYEGYQSNFMLEDYNVIKNSFNTHKIIKCD